MKTYSKLLTVLFVIGLSILYSCNSRPNNANDNMDNDDTAQGDNTNAMSMDDKAGTDAEALAWVMQVDNNEINAAQEAQKKKISQPVMDYAKMLEKEHSDNLQKTKDMSQSMNEMPAETQAVEDLKAKGNDMLSSLSSMDGMDFERNYIDAMVKGHTEALSMLDNQLIPNAKSADLKNHLTETRQHVAMHLDRAKELQGKM